MATFEKLFEVSWEVCNFVGGIHTVLKTKTTQGISHFKDYILIGPWLDTNDGFIEAADLFSENIRNTLQERGLHCRFGYWDTEGKPRVILVAYKNLNANDILYQLWKNYGVESHSAQYEYIEPVLFSTAAAKVIEAIVQKGEYETGQTFAHFHEWLTGAGLLYLKKHRPDICTVFTIHATVMGRAISSHGNSIFALPPEHDFSVEANKFNLLDKHSLEKAAANEADSFTAVSYTTADEAKIILKVYPDKITFNGLNFETKKDLPTDEQQRIQAREKLIDVASKMLKQSLPNNTRIWITAGRSEFHNKGYDVLLSSLAKLESKLSETAPPIIVFFCLPINRYNQSDWLSNQNLPEATQHSHSALLLTHPIDHANTDPILQYAKNFKFDNTKRKVHIVYSPAILSGSDGVFDIPYNTLITACDLTIFPSFYEPWGYTPLESIACGVPTITTDLTGFSSWVRSLSVDYSDSVYVIDRRGIHDNDFIIRLTNLLEEQLLQDPPPNIRLKTLALSKFADWKFFYKNYVDAYEQAVDDRAIRVSKTYLAKFDERVSADIAKISAQTTKIRALNADFCFPYELKDFVEYCYNLWWSWQLNTYQLFARLSPSLWPKVKFNPVKLLNKLPLDELTNKIKSETFSKSFHEDYSKLKDYCNDKTTVFDSEFINPKNPIAYFCMEYGIHESLPLYAGGLGILAGDTLKTASDVNLPLIAFGLFYKYGYFSQTIDSSGHQVANPDFNETYQEPLTLLKKKNGQEILIEIELPGRVCYLRIWKVYVGRRILYLLDADTPMNNEEDRKITLNLYPHEIETRLLQGLLLGIGGIRLINNVLNVQPSVFHMNECHTAFFLLERMKNLVGLGYTVRESVEIVRKTTVYTIHTSVLAAQEIYTDDMLRKYFLKDVQKIGIDIADFIALGRTITKNPNNFFSLTASAIRSSYNVNAVSKLHRKVSQKIWSDLWPNALESEVPISSVTNGIHVPTWLGSHMWTLYNKHLPENWLNNLNDKAVWEHVYNIPDAEMWDAHQLQKKQLLHVIRDKILIDYISRGENKKLMDKTLSHLHGNPFIIVFSRRFVQYKRPAFIFKNPEYLAAIFKHPERPVILLLAGKAHPFDGLGREIIYETIQQARKEMFDGRVIFLEDYDISISRFLVTGADLWLNNPIFGMEACGTSGMKAAINGSINYSVKDGWWYEAYTPEIGWKIDRCDEKIIDDTKREEIESLMMLAKLQNEIIPTYFALAKNGYPEEWIKKMKKAIVEVGYQYNSQRMLRDYYDLFYSPAATRYRALTASNAKAVSEYIEWKNYITKYLKSITIKKAHINVINKTTDNINEPMLDISIDLDPGKLKPEDFIVELLLMKNTQTEEEATSLVVPLELITTKKDTILTYKLKYEIQENGVYAYSVRISPRHPMLRNGTELEQVIWI